MLDVKASEVGVPLLLRPLLELVAPGSTFADPTINTHARVELKQVEIQEGMLPIAVPDLRFNYVFATFVNEVNGAVLGTVQLTKAGSSGANQLWNTTTPVSVTIPSAHVGVRLRLVGGADPTAACGTLFTECYDTDSTNGVVHIRGWSTRHGAGGAQRLAARRLVRSRRVLRDGRLQRRDPGRGRPRRHPRAHRRRRHRRRLGERRRRRPLLARAGRHLGARHLDLDRRPADRRQRSPHGRAELELEARPRARGSMRTERPRIARRANGNKCKDEGTFGPVQRAFIAGGRSGPLRSVQVFESGLTSSGSNSFQTGTAHTLGVSLAVTGSLKVQSLATDPVIELRVTGSQNQSIDCDPAVSNLRDEINEGCGPAYKINKTPRVPRVQHPLEPAGAVGVREDADRRRRRPGRAGAEGQDPRRLQLLHGADQLAELRARTTRGSCR